MDYIENSGGSVFSAVCHEGQLRDSQELGGGEKICARAHTDSQVIS
jgi:hypothetical protein